MREYLLLGARVINPAEGLSELRDLGVRNGLLCPAEDLSPEAISLHLRGKVVTPGFLDLHVHLRDPGQTYKEDLQTASAAAAGAGFTAVLAMPNTAPAMDNPAAIREITTRAEQLGVITVYQSAALTVGRKGEQLTDFAALKAAGVLALTDDGSTPQDEALMRSAMLAAQELSLPVIDHCEDVSLSCGGVMHAGAVSAELAVPGQPRAAEERIVERNIRLARETGCRVHLQHLSSAGSVDKLRQAQREGLPVTGEVTPHHLFFTDAAVRQYGSQAKMAPPLREESDRQALLQGLADGTLSVLATDHAPHSAEEKARGLLSAPFGIIGLEAAVPVGLTLLYHSGLLSLEQFIALFTVGPRKVLGLPPPSLVNGAPAELTILDPEVEHTLEVASFHSKSRNCPWQGVSCRGRALGSLSHGQLWGEVWDCHLSGRHGKSDAG